jgi:hypothetical protein
LRPGSANTLKTRIKSIIFILAGGAGEHAYSSLRLQDGAGRVVCRRCSALSEAVKSPAGASPDSVCTSKAGKHFRRVMSKRQGVRWSFFPYVR